MARKYLNISAEQMKYVEKYWGPIEEIEDEMAGEIVETLTGNVNVHDAWFLDIDTISYEVGNDDVDDEDEPYPAFTEEYLRFIGVSMKDFI